MPRFVALLRGVNLGGHHLVPMARLRSLVEALGHQDVVTLLQSGNVVFTAKERNGRKLEKVLSQALEKEFGFPVPVVVRTHQALKDAVAQCPYPRPEKDHKAHYLFFLSEPLDDEGLSLLDAKKFLPDEFWVEGRHIYGRFPESFGRSKLGTLLSGTRLGVVVTARNWKTVQSLLALSGDV